MNTNIWFTSDTHFYHNRILEFCPNSREGRDSDEMSEIIIERWNKLIRKDDIVYHLGDFCFRSKQHVIDTACRLNGKIHMILGNHDHHIIKDEVVGALFESVQRGKWVTVGKQKFDLTHTPQAEWVDCHKGAIHLHGHLHGNKDNIQYQQQFKIMDVGVDTRSDKSMLPYHIEEVLDFVKDRKVMTHHD